MDKRSRLYTKILGFLKSPWLYLLLLICFSIAWFAKDSLTPILFFGKSFEGRSILFQTGVFFIQYLLIFLVTYYFCKLLRQFIPGRFLVKLKSISLLNAAIKVPNEKRTVLILGIFITGLLVITSINTILPMIHTDNWTFGSPVLFGLMSPVGADFRSGLYRATNNLLSGQPIYADISNDHPSNIYPPLVYVLSIPYLLLDENSAYLFQLVLLLLANIACLGIVTLLIKDVLLNKFITDKKTIWMISLVLFQGMIFYALTSYHFLFSIERGNFDILALLFALLSVWSLIKTPNRIWLQVILLSISVHLKIYPAALFILLLLKHGRKIIIPAIIINTGFFLVLGPQNLLNFMVSLFRFGNFELSWFGNHSASSAAIKLAQIIPMFNNETLFIKLLLTLLPCVVWLWTLLQVIKSKFNDPGILFLLMVTIPLMEILPSISHDYKLVILNTAVIILLSMIIINIIKTSRLIDYLQFILVLAILLSIGRSYVINPQNLFIFNNKYFMVLALEILMYLNVLRFQKLLGPSPYSPKEGVS